MPISSRQRKTRNFDPVGPTAPHLEGDLKILLQLQRKVTQQKMRVGCQRLLGRACLAAAVCLSLLPADIRADVCGKPSKESWEGDCSRSAVSASTRCLSCVCVPKAHQPRQSSGAAGC